jgi:PKD repeat protein
MAEKCESGSVYFSSTVTINGCTIKGIALETNGKPTHRIHITLPWGEKKDFVGIQPLVCNFYYTNGHATLCKVCLDKVEGYTCYYTVCRTVEVEYCSQNVRVVTSDGASVSAHIVWGDGADEYGTTPNTFTHRYEKGKSPTVTASATGYTSASKTFTTCISQFTLTLTKGVAPPPDAAKFKLSEVVENHLPEWISGYACAGCGASYPYKCPAGYNRTVCRSERGGTHGCCPSCMVAFVKCEQEGVACSEWTTKSMCESHGCFWYNNTCHEYGPVKCSDYTDALTCAANNCYWWSDGTCHDTEEAPPVSAYEECGRAPISSDSKTYTTDWWKCAYAVAEKRGICVTRWSKWGNEARGDIKKELGSIPHYLSESNTPDGDYVKIGMGDRPEVYLGRFKWKCPLVVKKDTVICDFNIYDAAGNKVTDLVAGVRYAIKAYLCKVEGGGCAEILKGCDSGCEVSGEELKLFLSGQAAELEKGTTNVDGYTAFYWTPSADIAGDNSIKLEFKGSANYNASESATKTVTVSGLRIKCDCTNIDVGDRVFLQEAKQVRGKWVHNILGGGESKKVTADKVLYFTGHDPILGFGVGKHYSIIAWKWWESYIAFKPLLNFIVPDYSVIELKEGLNEVTVRYQVSIIGTTICGFFGIEPESTECSLFLAEFADPVFVANTLSVIAKGEDLEGNLREPETLDYVMLPIVMVGSLLPMVPMGKISQWTGRGLKLAKKSVASKTFLIKHHQKIHHLTAVGDETRILKFKAFFDADKLNDALKVLDEGVVASEATEAAKALKRASLRKWVRGIIAKWKKDNPKTTIEKLMDDTAEHGGNVFKTQADVIVKHVDDAGGDWTKIRKIWGDTVKTADDVVYVDLNLAGKSDDVQVIHNMMRYSKDDFVKALKAEDAINPKFANRFDEGVDFMLRHIGDETGTEVAKYRKAIKGLSDTDINNIVKNLDAVGQTNLARTIKTLKVAPERGMKYFDDVEAALRGTKKLTKEGRKAVGAVLDSGIDDAMKHLDAKWEKIGKVVLETDDPLKNPQFQRFWRHVKGSPKAKAAMAEYGTPKFRGLPLWLKLSVLMGAFFTVNTAWKWLQDFCFGLFMGEETIQWGGFGGISLMRLLDGYEQQPLARRKEIIATFEEFYNKRAAIHAFVTGTPMPSLGDGELKALPDLGAGPLTGIFEHLCILFGPYFRGFWEADKINMWALAQLIDHLNRGINPFTGIGECSIKVRANKDGVHFWYQGSQTKWYGGRAFSEVEILSVPVRDEPYICSIMAWLPGYKVAEKRITIYREDVGATGAKAKTLELFDMIPESALTDTGATNPFPQQAAPDTTSLPTPYGNADPAEYISGVTYGSIRCESIPTGAGVYLDVKDSAHYKGKTDITLEHLSVGTHKIIQTFPNFNDCVVNVNVVVEPMVYARCRFPTPTCSFTPSTTKPKLNEVVTFDASASTAGTGAASLTYDWDWGDLKTHGTKKIETHAYTAKGVYAVKLTVTNEMGGSKVCTTNITVEVATGNIKCYCELAEYCGRNADIFVDGKKVDVTKESGYAYIKNLTPGVHTVKYNLLDVMECSGSVTVTADVDVDFKCQLKSKLPASQTAKVTAIVDGDGIKTDKTGNHEIRIIGFDAFECRVYPSDCTLMGKYGYEKLKSLIPVGTSVTLKIDQWLPLGVYNRVIADIFVGATDIAAEMLKSCLVRFPAKTYRDKYYWDPWDEYERIWCDPTKVIPPDEYKPEIIDIDVRRKTFKIKNNWLALWFLPEFVDSGGTILGKATERKTEVGKTSTAITYFAGTHAIKLYARVDTKDDWTLVDTGYVSAAPPVTKTVTFKSVPSGASVTVTKVATAHALHRPLKRLTQSLKKVRSM